MRKFLTIGISVIFFLCLFGCNSNDRQLMSGLESIVTAIGFEKKNDIVSVCFETVTTNSEDLAAERKLEIISGNGKNLVTALDNLSQKAVRPFLFSHCAVAVIGDGINEKEFRDIYKFLYNKEEINLSLKFISCKEAEKLLSCEAVASVAVGYDLVDTLSHQTDSKGMIYKNRFFEIAAAREKAVNVFTLPYFSVENNRFYLNGLTVFKNDAPTLKLKNDDASVFFMVTENQKEGSIIINNKELKIKDLSVEYKFYLKENLQTHIELLIDTQEQNKDFEKISETIEKIFLTSKETGTDIFGIGNYLHKKENSIWNKIKHDYYNMYINSKLTVCVK